LLVSVIIIFDVYNAGLKYIGLFVCEKKEKSSDVTVHRNP